MKSLLTVSALLGALTSTCFGALPCAASEPERHILEEHFDEERLARPITSILLRLWPRTDDLYRIGACLKSTTLALLLGTSLEQLDEVIDIEAFCDLADATGDPRRTVGAKQVLFIKLFNRDTWQRLLGCDDIEPLIRTSAKLLYGEELTLKKRQKLCKELKSHIEKLNISRFDTKDLVDALTSYDGSTESTKRIEETLPWTAFDDEYPFMSTLLKLIWAVVAHDISLFTNMRGSTFNTQEAVQIIGRLLSENPELASPFVHPDKLVAVARKIRSNQNLTGEDLKAIPRKEAIHLALRQAGNDPLDIDQLFNYAKCAEGINQLRRGDSSGYDTIIKNIHHPTLQALLTLIPDPSEHSVAEAFKASRKAATHIGVQLAKTNLTHLMPLFSLDDLTKQLAHLEKTKQISAEQLKSTVHPIVLSAASRYIDFDKLAHGITTLYTTGKLSHELTSAVDLQKLSDEQGLPFKDATSTAVADVVQQRAQAHIMHTFIEGALIRYVAINLLAAVWVLSLAGHMLCHDVLDMLTPVSPLINIPLICAIIYITWKANPYPGNKPTWMDTALTASTRHAGRLLCKALPYEQKSAHLPVPKKYEEFANKASQTIGKKLARPQDLNILFKNARSFVARHPQLIAALCDGSKEHCKMLCALLDEHYPQDSLTFTAQSKKVIHECKIMSSLDATDNDPVDEVWDIAERAPHLMLARSYRKTLRNLDRYLLDTNGTKKSLRKHYEALLDDAFEQHEQDLNAYDALLLEQASVQ